MKLHYETSRLSNRHLTMKSLTLLAILLLALFSPCFCLRGGKSVDPKIVGGVDIDIREAPYQVSLQYFGAHICGGAIISKDYVITAAHCTIGRTARTLTVRVGSTKNFEGGVIHTVAVIKQHPRFNRISFDFDVSLLQLNRSITINDDTTQEISLPRAGEGIPEKTAVLVSGFGDTRSALEDNRFLRAVILGVSNQRQCHLKYLVDGGVTPRMFCAHTLQKDSCSGDSGGPVRRLVDGVLVGLVSFGPGNECASATIPGVYTRIAAVRPWIKQNARV